MYGHVYMLIRYVKCPFSSPDTWSEGIAQKVNWVTSFYVQPLKGLVFYYLKKITKYCANLRSAMFAGFAVTSMAPPA